MITMFYLVCPAQLQEVYGYCYINKEFISQQTSVNPNTIKLFIPYLETKEKELTAKRKVYVKPQREQLNARHTLYIEPH
jgi:hypothetical protein